MHVWLSIASFSHADLSSSKTRRSIKAARLVHVTAYDVGNVLQCQQDLAIKNYEHQRRPNVVSPRWRPPLGLPRFTGDDAASPNRLFCG